MLHITKNYALQILCGEPHKICNDEGKNMGLPLNRVLENYDIIAGAFFVCGIQGENFSSLTEKQMQKYQQMFLSPEKFIQTPEGLLCIRINPVVSPKPKTKKPPNHER